MTRPSSISGKIPERLPRKDSSLAVIGKIHAEFYRAPEKNTAMDKAGQGQAGPSTQKEVACWHTLSGFINWLCGFESENG